MIHLAIGFKVILTAVALKVLRSPGIISFYFYIIFLACKI